MKKKSNPPMAKMKAMAKKKGPMAKTGKTMEHKAMLKEMKDM